MSAMSLILSNWNLKLVFLIIITSSAASAKAQQMGNGSYVSAQYEQNSSFDPSMGIVMVVMVCVFFLIGIFSILLRQCSDIAPDYSSAAARFFRSPGLDKSVIESFPVLDYSKVKTGSLGALECAVCLSEFEKDELLRVLPKCGHVFHPGCIDTWLASHVTCPVCRSNLRDVTRSKASSVIPETVSSTSEVNLEVVIIQVNELEETRPVRFPRSHSTGHSLLKLEEEEEEKEDMSRRRIIERAASFNNAASLPREWSWKKPYTSSNYFIGCGGGGEGSSSSSSSCSSNSSSSRGGRWVFSMTPPFVSKEGVGRDSVNCAGLWSSVKVPSNCVVNKVEGVVVREGETSPALARPLV